MIRHGCTKMIISPLIFKIQRRVTYQKIALDDIYSLIKSIMLYYNAHEKDRLLKKTFENYYINFSNSDFSVDIASICTKVFVYPSHNPTEGSMSQNFDLGPG